MKKLLVFLALAVAMGIVSFLVDTSFGVEFKEGVSSIDEIAHALVYVVFGAVMERCLKLL
jgi:hypothetical protein